MRKLFPILCLSLLCSGATYDYAKDFHKQLVLIQLQQAARLYNEGRLSEAVGVAQETLRFAGNALGADHPDLATPLNHLALLYQAQGEYSKAEPLYQKAVKIQEKALGKDHLELAKTLNNLALLYQAQA